MISVNDIFMYIENGKEFRILWISPENDLAYIIELVTNKMPVPISPIELKRQLQDGNIEIKKDDPYINKLPEHLISSKNKALRESSWNVVKDIVEKEPAIYDKKLRGQMIAEFAGNNNSLQVILYRLLKRYWCRGKNKNAFLPNYHNSGGKGKERIARDKKIGRPSKYGENIGKNVDEATKAIFEKAVKKYYHTRHEYSFKATYEFMVKEHYTKPVEQPDSTVRHELIDPNDIPSLRQFQYWYSKRYDHKEKLISRKGQKQFDLNHRAILGKSDIDIRGPGAQYQIDATVGDIYLVSQFNRSNIIGRPVIYFVIDAFSRMVTGMYIGLEGPSWMGCTMALANAATDKVAYCADYGIAIANEEWPCHHIPDTILTDRGEMESKSVETLINTLNIRIDNAPAYRADMKGIVEQFFRTINTKTTMLLPGFVKPDMLQRGGKDYRLDAKLDIRQFTKIIIQCVLNHNNKHFLGNYERTEGMIADAVNTIPINLWEWGISNYSGLLRSVTEDTIKLCLMPTDTALVTARGIQFKGLFYLSERAIYESWFETARAKGNYRVDISYDPRDMTNIYVRNLYDSLFEKCYLSEWEAKWNKKSLDEILHQQVEERALRHQNKSRTLQANVDLITEVEKIVTEADEMSRQTAIPSSKKERISHIRENRAKEKEQIRGDEAFVLDDVDKVSLLQPHSTQKKPMHPITALIKKMTEEEYDE